MEQSFAATKNDLETINKDWSREKLEDYIARLPIWNSGTRPTLTWLVGGLINRNWVVQDGNRKYVARVFFDAGVQGISEQSVLASTRAAAEIGVTPQLRYSEPHLTVVDFIDGRHLQEEELLDEGLISKCMERVRALHLGTKATRMPINFHGRPMVIRSLVKWSVENRSPHADAVSGVLPLVERLEERQQPYKPCLTHNDLAHVNVMLDKAGRIWLIDWDFGAIGHPLSDISDLLSYGPPNDGIEHCALRAYLGPGVTGAKFDIAMQEYRISLLLTYAFQFAWSAAVDHSTHKSAEDIRESMQSILPNQEASYRGFMSMARDRLDDSLRRFSPFLG